MPKVIDKEAALKLVSDPHNQYHRIVKEFLLTAPTIEAEPVRHGRWIDTPIPNNNVAKCSLCGFWMKTNGEDKTGKHMIHKAVYRYCAGCGARMDGGDDNDSE